MNKRQQLAHLARLCALAAIYFVCGKLGLMLAFVNVSASAVWPPSGLALAAALVLGYRIWPAIFAGAFLVNATTAGTFATSLGIATGNTLEAMLGAFLVNRFANGRHAFNRAQDVFRLAFLAGMLSTGLSATFGVTSLLAGGFLSWGEYARVWLAWWLGDAAGVLIVAPVALLWYLQPRLRCARRQFLEACALLVAVIALGLIVFGNVLPLGIDYPIWFFCIPLLVWIAARFGQRETATATFLLSAVAIWGTLHGFGPFVRGSPHESLLLLQTLMSVIAMMAMALSASLFERRRLEAHLVHLAEHDPLTDLLSRRGFHAELWRQLATTKRYGTPGCLLFLDLDDFKRVNDTLGHAAGDRVLNNLAALLRARLRDSDLLARLGGDEFAILLPHASGEQARLVAEQLLAAIRAHTISIEGRPVTVSASIGLALFPDDGHTLEDVLAGADAAMYRAKAAGGNCIFACSRELDRPGLDRELPDPDAVRTVFEAGGMLLYGYPILDLRHNRIYQYELLPRLPAASGGERFAAAAVQAAAERSGAIHAIDRWVVSQAIALLGRPRSRGQPLQLCVNLSTKALADGELVQGIQSALRGSPADPHNLVLEISEIATLSDAERARTFVRQVKAMGCQIALNRFGTGLFSLSQLKRLPVDYLKIDEHLIRDLEDDRVDRHLVEAIVGVARALGPKTVGEGVGDSTTMRLLLECGVDYCQGPQVGAPRAAAQIFSPT